MKTVEIFRAGTRHDANGQLVTITADDLKAVAENYSPEYHEAPLVIGHPKSDLPAYGWVRRLSVDGDVLKADVDQVDAEFAELVAAGKYKKVSAAFYMPSAKANPKAGAFYLRHVGFLGAMPPAVKGLRNPEFNDGEQDVVEFTEDFVQDGAESAQENEATNEADVVPQTATPDTTENHSTGETMELEKENEALKAENARLQAVLAAQEKAKAEAENVAFAEGLIKEGRLAPAQKEVVLGLLNADIQSAEFAEGGFKGQLKGFLSGLSPVVTTTTVASAEVAVKSETETVEYAEGTDPAAIDADKKVRAFMQEHSVDYATAFSRVYS